MPFDGNERNPCARRDSKMRMQDLPKLPKNLEMRFIVHLVLVPGHPLKFGPRNCPQWMVDCRRMDRKSLSPETITSVYLFNEKIKERKKYFLASTIDWLDCKQSRLNSTSSGGRTNSPFHPIFLADCGFIKVDSMGRGFNKRRITSYLCPDRFFLHFLSNIMS